MVYVIDADVVIQAKNLHYGFGDPGRVGPLGSTRVPARSPERTRDAHSRPPSAPRPVVTA
jgi:hypothetical protein